MFRKLLLVFISICSPVIIHSYCYSKTSQTWFCNNGDKYNNTPITDNDYEKILNQENFEKFYLKNYQLSRFKLDNYSLTLSLLNASNNQFENIIITSKNAAKSSLRQLILQSNSIRYFNSSTIVLPKSLEKISLANNQLEILDARIFLSLKNLIKIDLRNNQLKRILPQLVLQTNIQLNNNPLNCQCTPEFYRIICEKSTNRKQSLIESNNCMAPYHESHPYDNHPTAYLRFSTFTLICPINGQPPPIIIWSTSFGNLTSMNSSDIDLLSSSNNQSIYTRLIVRTGPFTTRTRHVLYAFNKTYLSVTRARASLQNDLSCTGINMLGTYTYKFDFNIDTFAKKHAVWYIIYTLAFGFFMSLLGGALCVTLKRTNYYSVDRLKTPPVYPTLTPNSAARTPPNFEINQWLSSAAANISGTLEQVRDKLRIGVQHVSGQMGRATELLTHSMQHAASTSASYLQSFRETSQHRFNTIRVQTLSSLRTSGQFMRAGMNMLTTQVNSLRDYCGVITNQSLANSYLSQHQQQQYIRNSRTSISYPYQQPLSTIIENNENSMESTMLINRSPHVGDIPLVMVDNASGIGQLDAADNSVLLALNNFNSDAINQLDHQEMNAGGQMFGGIGTFHDHHQHDELVNEQEKFILYGEQRPSS